jgi:hypothetical protein
MKTIDIELGEFTNDEIHQLTGLIDEKLSDMGITPQSYAFSIMVTYTPEEQFEEFMEFENE